MFRRGKMLVELRLGCEFNVTEVAFPGSSVPCLISCSIRRWRSVLPGRAIGDHAPRIGDNILHIMLQNVGIYHVSGNSTIASTGLEVEDDV